MIDARCQPWSPCSTIAVVCRSLSASSSLSSFPSFRSMPVTAARYARRAFRVSFAESGTHGLGWIGGTQLGQPSDMWNAMGGMPTGGSGWSGRSIVSRGCLAQSSAAACHGLPFARSSDVRPAQHSQRSATYGENGRSGRRLWAAAHMCGLCIPTAR